MTRINAGIPVEELCDAHILAEHREITRIPNSIKSGKVKIKDIPENFKLGTGHVKFFYNKLLYLKKRYILLHTICKRKKFKVENKISSFDDLPEELMNDWTPEQNSIDIVRQRINERLSKMKNVKYTEIED